MPDVLAPGRVDRMIRVSSLTKQYGDFTAVKDVTFTCRPGRVTGFLGPNGAGKTTTMRVMVGLTPATAGDVRIGVFTDAPESLARVALAHLGAERRVDALETGAGARERLLAALGSDGLEVATTLAELTSITTNG